jgi:DNA invertase Pin-like site-specific DNA recombinase
MSLNKNGSRPVPPVDYEEAIYYIRVSSEGQTEGSGLERQLAGIREYCFRHNSIISGKHLRLNEEMSETDEGVSAYTQANLQLDAGLGRILYRVKKGIFPFKVLVTEHPDRLSRAGIDATTDIVRTLIDGGVEIHFTMCNLVLHKNNREDVNAVIQGVLYAHQAKKGSEDKAIRVHDGWVKSKRNLAEKGEALTLHCPRWMKVVINQMTGKREYELIPDRVETVIQIFKWSAEGYGSLKIVHLLTEGNKQNPNKYKPFTLTYVPKAPRKERKRKRPIHKVQVWESGYIRQILNNRAVLGEFRSRMCPNGKRQKDVDREGCYPAIFDNTELWDLSRESRALRTYNANGSRGRGGDRGGGPVSEDVVNLFPAWKIYDITNEREKRMYVETFDGRMSKKRSYGHKYLYLGSNPAFDEGPHRLRYDFFEEAFKFYWTHLDWDAIRGKTETPEMKADRTELAGLKGELRKLDGQIKKDERELGEMPDSRAAKKALDEAYDRRDELTVKIGTLEKRIDDRMVKLKEFTDDEEFKELLKQVTPEAIEARKRVRTEILIRVRRINFQFFAHPILGQLAKVTFIFVTGVERVMRLYTKAFYALFEDLNGKHVERMDFEPFEPDNPLRISREIAREVHRLERQNFSVLETATELGVSVDFVRRTRCGKRFPEVYAEFHGHFPGTNMKLPEVEMEEARKNAKALDKHQRSKRPLPVLNQLRRMKS